MPEKQHEQHNDGSILPNDPGAQKREASEIIIKDTILVSALPIHGGHSLENKKKVPILLAIQ